MILCPPQEITAKLNIRSLMQLVWPVVMISIIASRDRSRSNRVGTRE